MKRILIIGSGGSGKSTLSQRLGALLHLPVVHLDAHFWNPGWVEKEPEEWDGIVHQLLHEPAWIMDGNYGRTMDLRIEKADLVVYLDMPRLLCMYRIVKRRFMYHNRSRPDMREGCHEKLDWPFVKWVWQYRKRSRDATLERLERAAAGRKVVILKSRREVQDFLRKLEETQHRRRA